MDELIRPFPVGVAVVGQIQTDQTDAIVAVYAAMIALALTQRNCLVSAILLHSQDYMNVLAAALTAAI